MKKRYIVKYNNNIIFLEKIISQALIDINQPVLLKNNDFKLLKNTTHYKHYVVFTLKKTDKTSILFWLENGDLRIDIDRTSETYTYDMKFIKENEEYIKNIITMIFTCSIKVKYCGENYTKLYFINKKEKTLNTFSFTTGFLGFFGLVSKKNCREKIYPPIYPSEKVCLTEPVIPNSNS